jgi:uncharacterized Ntn-hydrolase superfamily protein
MTWSILARDATTGTVGIAIATRFFAVGALCPWGDGAIGLVATQALVNPTLGPRGLRLMKDGVPPEAALAALIASDPGRATRQLHLLDRHGVGARHTGGDCVAWCGHLGERDLSVAGNMLAGPGVIEASAEVMRREQDLPFARRLIRALEAGEAAGGDKRGKQSASLTLWRSEEYPLLSLRVDDHPDPLSELARLEAVSRERFVHFAQFFATRDNPSGVFDRAVIERAIQDAATPPAA